MRVVLHIGRLVLDGVEPHQAGAVREALTAELSRLLTATPDHQWRVSQRQRRIAVPPLPPPAGGPERLGRTVAGSVYAGITSPQRRGS